MARPGKRGSIRSELVDARSALEQAEVWDAWLDAEVLLAHVLGTERSWLHAHPERPLTAAQRRRFRELIARRAERVPVAYMTGEKEFYGHMLHVSAAVLIPRPETELLVDLAIEWLRGHPQARRVIDLGTGSGAIAIAVAKAMPSIRIIARDVDNRALKVAGRNIVEHRVASRVSLERADLLQGAAPADLIAANLPYLTTVRMRSQPELAHEPSRALDGGRDGLDLIRRAIAQAPGVIRAGGCLLFECDPGQTARIGRLAAQAWASATVTVHKDIAGRDRVVRIQL
jgi:release factor glutamine methyltransferase